MRDTITDGPAREQTSGTSRVGGLLNFDLGHPKVRLARLNLTSPEPRAMPRDRSARPAEGMARRANRISSCEDKSSSCSPSIGFPSNSHAASPHRVLFPVQRGHRNLRAHVSLKQRTINFAHGKRCLIWRSKRNSGPLAVGGLDFRRGTS